MSPTPDFLDDALGLEPESRLAALRAERPEVRLHSQTSAEALFAPDTPDGLSACERFAAALRVASLNDSTALADAYRARLADTWDGAAFLAALEVGATDRLDQRHGVILDHVELLALRPAEARPANLHTLRAAGLSTLAIVSLAQIVSFVSYQVRVAAGLSLLEQVR